MRRRVGPDRRPAWRECDDRRHGLARSACCLPGRSGLHPVPTHRRSERPMRIGAVFPQTEIGNDPEVIRDWAERVEDLGYRHVLAFDHVLGAGTDTRPGWTGPYTSETPFHEVFALFGFLAAVTRSTELVTGILILPQRPTALVAKQAAAVDVLSSGRLRLGIGIGW